MSKKGFTLIELMVVIAVIAVLATIALVGLGGVQKGARDTQRLATMNGIRTALERYNADKGSYPASPFVAMVTTLTGGSYLTGVFDPGCGSGASNFATTATDAVGDWNPCSTATAPSYSYGMAGGIYTMALVKESAGIATLKGPL